MAFPGRHIGGTEEDVESPSPKRLQACREGQLGCYNVNEINTYIQEWEKILEGASPSFVSQRWCPRAELDLNLNRGESEPHQCGPPDDTQRTVKKQVRNAQQRRDKVFQELRHSERGLVIGKLFLHGPQRGSAREVLVTKAEDLSLIPRDHMMERTDHLLQVVL